MLEWGVGGTGREIISTKSAGKAKDGREGERGRVGTV